MLMIACIGFGLLTHHWMIERRSLEKKNQEELSLIHAEHLLTMKERVARQSAEKRLYGRQQFLSNISEELKNPLTAIAGFTELLTRHGISLSDEDKTNLADQIMGNVSLLSALTDKMLELAYYEQMSEINLRDKVQVNYLCQNVLDSFQEMVHNDVQLNFITNLPDDYVIHSNEEYLKKVIHHLLACSVRFTRQGHIDLSVSDNGHRETISFAVSDTGIGIPREQQKKIFEALPDTDGALKITGMELFISRRLVRLLDGSIFLDPHYTDGTRFVFSIKA